MDKLKYDFLTEIQGRWQAELLKSFFEAGGIPVELFQESLGQHIYPTALDILGNVQIYVPIAQMKQAKALLEEFYNPPKIEKPKTKKKTARKPASQSSVAKKGKAK